MTTIDADDVLWDLSDLLDGRDDEAAVLELLDEADRIADELAKGRGQVAGVDAGALARAWTPRPGCPTSWAAPARGRSCASSPTSPTPPAARSCSTRGAGHRHRAPKLLFFELEWAALDDERVDALLADERARVRRHHLRSARRYRDHLLTEPEERILIEKSVTGASAWSRLFSELTSVIEVELDGAPDDPGGGPEPAALADPAGAGRRRPTRSPRRSSRGCAPARSSSTRCCTTRPSTTACAATPRGSRAGTCPNEASDESVEALVEAVAGPLRHPAALVPAQGPRPRRRPAQGLRPHGQPGHRGQPIGWDEATRPRARLRTRRSRPSWPTSPAGSSTSAGSTPRPGRASAPGAFCAYTVPSRPPLRAAQLDRRAARRADARPRARPRPARLPGPAAGRVPPGRRRSRWPRPRRCSARPSPSAGCSRMTTDPADRLALLAENIEGAIATVFRQTAMNRFEDGVHTARRDEGELSVDRFGELWVATQPGDARRRRRAHRGLPHAGGRTSRTSSARRATCTPTPTGSCSPCRCIASTRSRGPTSCPATSHLLSAGGSMPPEELGRIVGCDLADPAFWDGGLAIVEAAARRGRGGGVRGRPPAWLTCSDRAQDRLGERRAGRGRRVAGPHRHHRDLEGAGRRPGRRRGREPRRRRPGRPARARRARQGGLRLRGRGLRWWAGSAGASRRARSART